MSTALPGAAGKSRGFVAQFIAVTAVTIAALGAVTLLAALSVPIPDVLIVIVSGGSTYLLGNAVGIREGRSSSNGKGGSDGPD